MNLRTIYFVTMYFVSICSALALGACQPSTTSNEGDISGTSAPSAALHVKSETKLYTGGTLLPKETCKLLPGTYPLSRAPTKRTERGKTWLLVIFSSAPTGCPAHGMVQHSNAIEITESQPVIASIKATEGLDGYDEAWGNQLANAITDISNQYGKSTDRNDPCFSLDSPEIMMQPLAIEQCYA